MDELHDMVDALSAALEAKSAYTCGHSERVAEIVVGYPLNMNGTSGARVVRTDEFLAELAKRTAIPLKKWDERLSTKIAESVLIEAGTRREKRRGVVDKLAAQIILQGYLDAATPPIGGWEP